MFLNIKWSRLVKTIRKRDILVRFFEWFEPFENQPSKCQDLNETGFRMVGFLIPTVLMFGSVFMPWLE